MASFYGYDQSESPENGRKEILSDEMAALLQSIQRPRFTRESLNRLVRFLLVMGLLAVIVFGAHLIWQPETLSGEETAASSQELAAESVPGSSPGEAGYALEIVERESAPLQAEIFFQLMLGLCAIGFIAAACLIIAGRRYARHRWPA